MADDKPVTFYFARLWNGIYFLPAIELYFHKDDNTRNDRYHLHFGITWLFWTCELTLGPSWVD